MVLAETRTAEAFDHASAGTPAATVSVVSAISWSAVLAGATIAAAASIVLLSLGTGLGLSAISPWAEKGVRGTTFGLSSIVWVIVTQLCASALGGYLAGRLRVRWSGIHSDEVYFRDTAHGLLSWAVATLVTASILLAAASSALGTAAQVSATLASGATTAGAISMGKAATGNTEANGGDTMGYLVDSLFRQDTTVAVSDLEKTPDYSATVPSRMPVAEVTRIFSNASNLDGLTLPPADIRYLGLLVSQRTGLQQTDAERRVTDTYTALRSNVENAKASAAVAADKARKAGIQASLWLFIALLSGAFIASFTAMLGGRQRDD